MGSTIRAMLASAALIAAPAAFAAPTCQDQNGDTIKCGAAGAMPVGWSLPPEDRARLSGPMEPTPEEFWFLICVISAFVGIVAMMPDFDGSKGGDWDRQEGDERKRR